MDTHETPPVGDEVELREETSAEETHETPEPDETQRTNSALVAASRRKKERHRAVPLMPEVRHFRADGLEVRSNSKTDEIVITGAPIVYERDYQVTDMLGQFTERMAPGVAKDVLPKADVRFLFNHDGLPLARTASGTMALQDTDSELRFTASLDARQQLANDLAIAIQRGDVSQMSCGFIVAEDRWSEDWEDRTITRFDDLLDVSAVTYPASPTTSIEVAQRMALRMPIESGARVRKAYVALRAGKVLSATNQDKLLNAVGSLHDVLSGAGVDLSQLDADAAADGSEMEPDVTVSPDGSTGGNDNAESPAGADGTTRSADLIANEEGEPIHIHRKAAPATATERRTQSLSFGDRQSAVYAALCAKFGAYGGYPDIWICDCGEDWVVWEAYGPTGGMFRLGYSVDGDGTVTLSDDAPEPVRIDTSYVTARAAIDQAWLESVVERGEGLHGSARKRAA